MHGEAWKLIDENHNITLVSHINPDADTLGSALALYPILKKMGKAVTLFNATESIANKYDFLPNFQKIKAVFPKKCDLAIVFDSGSLDRLGIEKKAFKIINIDHHISNTHFGDINIVNPHHASSTLVVMDLLLYKAPLSRESALCIYAGLVEDTGFFNFSNTDEAAFIAASKLVATGFDPALVAKNLKMRNSLAKTRLTARFIDSIDLLKDGVVAVGNISQEDFKKTGAHVSDSDHLVDILRNLATVELAILLLEKKDGTFKVSLRSKNALDVSLIAVTFGGGGHKNASGFESNEKDKTTLIRKIVEKAML